jgi:hypothetical protein
MLINKVTISVFVLLIVATTNAQTDADGRLSWWPAYYLKFSLNSRWALNSDLQLRNFNKEPLLGLLGLRTGAHYSFGEGWSTGIGVLWFHYESIANNKEFKADEFRVYEELRHDWRLNDKWLLANRLRTEQRTFSNQEGIAFRIRYHIAADYRLAKRWSAIVGDELMWQGSKRRKNWDQNRLWAGGAYAFNANNQVQLVFMNWWQYNAGIYQPVIRINFVQSINAGL